MSFYLPSELIPNILARLSSADALRCTSVCKAWYDLINSSSFMYSHLKLSIPNQESRLLVKHRNEAKEQLYNLYLDNQTCDFVVGLESQLVGNVKGNFGIVGSFNGLVCLTEFKKHDVNPAIILLWNPSIRKLFELPKPRIIYQNPSIGFCYIPETDDYKIVRVSGVNGHMGVEMYQLSTNSWHYVDVGGLANDLCMGLSMGVLGGFLNGKLHWIAFDIDIDGSIVSLDMKSEKFGTLMFPFCLRNKFNCIHVYKESLCAMQPTKFFYDVWVMNEYGVADSWALQFKIDKGVSLHLYVRDNGEFIYTHMQHIYLVSCDPTSKRITKIGCEKKVISEVTSYMESLVLLKTPNKIKKEAKKRRLT